MALSAYDLSERTAFVTGAGIGIGIGRACAALLAEAGARVHCADRNADGLDGTAALIEDHGGTARSTPSMPPTGPGSPSRSARRRSGRVRYFARMGA
jgi:NAD(P)-dependent dehydrogenase (short-subunit alcohol dehydrogenase family)